MNAIGIAVFGHGSSVESANESVRAVAREAAMQGGWKLYETAFLEASPRLEEAVEKLAAAGAAEILVVPYFLTLGIHLQRDLPRLVDDLSREIRPGHQYCTASGWPSQSQRYSGGSSEGAAQVRARLIGWRELAPGTRHFVFEADAASEWTGAFVPGQFLSLTATIAGEEITRAYSIATPPDGRRFGLCANVVADGRFSPWLFNLRPSDEIQFKGPYGAFVLRRPPADSLLVATGTGIAPFRSILQAQLNADPARHLTLIFGVRHRHGLLYDDEFRSLAETQTNFTYQPTLTRPDADWHGSTGRVQPHVLEALGERRDMDVYICGLREMVDDLRTQLKAAGLDRKRIIYEKYD